MKSILFLCVANSARSQIAEGLARKHFVDPLCTDSRASWQTPTDVDTL